MILFTPHGFPNWLTSDGWPTDSGHGIDRGQMDSPSLQLMWTAEKHQYQMHLGTRWDLNFSRCDANQLHRSEFIIFPFNLHWKLILRKADERDANNRLAAQNFWKWEPKMRANLLANSRWLSLKVDMGVLRLVRKLPEKADVFCGRWDVNGWPTWTMPGEDIEC